MTTLLAIILVAQEPTYEKELAPLAFLVGTLEGRGESPLGSYDETMTGEWAVQKTSIVVRSRSVADGHVVFEDLRVFSYDRASKKIRMRQFAMGDLIEYELVADGRTLTLRQTRNEGGVRPEWKYVLTPRADGVDYVLEAREGAAFKRYVAGSLRRPKSDDPLRDLAWLAGTWTGRLGQGTFEEHWTAPAGAQMLGMGRAVEGGRTSFHEFLRIEAKDGVITYWAAIDGQPEVGFTLVRITDREAVFENPRHDFPTRIVYRREGDGSLTARIEGEQGGKAAGQEFTLRRK